MPDVPGPPGHHLHGNEREFRADPQGFLLTNALRHGDLVRFRLGFRPCFLVSDPAEIQRVLAHPAAFADKRPGERHLHAYVRSVARTSGPEHRRRRRLLQSAFHPARLRAGVETTARVADEVLDGLPDAPALPLAAVLKRIVLRSMAVQLLGAEAARHHEVLEAPIATIEAWLGGAGHVREAQFEDARACLEALVLTLADRRRGRAGGVEPPTLLSQLLPGASPAGADPAGEEEAVLVDEVAMMLMTNLPVVQTAARAARYLAALPALDLQLDRELRAHLDGGPVREEALARAPLLDGLVRETLRLHPPVWTLAREARVHWPTGAHTLPARQRGADEPVRGAAPPAPLAAPRGVPAGALRARLPPRPRPPAPDLVPVRRRSAQVPGRADGAAAGPGGPGDAAAAVPPRAGPAPPARGAASVRGSRRRRPGPGWCCGRGLGDSVPGCGV
jgi:cytochrome P450